MCLSLRILGTMAVIWALCAISAQAQKLELVVETGHYGSVYSLEFNGDGSLLKSTGDDGGTKIWSVAESKQLRTLPAKEDGGHFYLTSNFDRRIWASADSERIILSDMDDGKRIRAIESDSEVTNLELSPDGRVLASSHKDKSVRLWDVVSGELRRKLATSPVAIGELIFTPDGKSLIVSEKDHVGFWDVSTYENYLNLNLEEPLLGYQVLVLSRDGKRLAGRSGSRIYLWDLPSGRALPPLTLESDPYPSFLFSNDNQAIISADYFGVITFRDIATGRTLRTLETDGRQVRSLALSPGNLLACGNDKGLIRLWDLKAGGKPSELVGHTGSIQVPRFSQGARMLSAHVADTPKFFDVVLGDTFVAPKRDDGYSPVAVSSDRHLYVGQNGLTNKLFDSSGKELFTLTEEGRTRSFAFSRDNKLLAAGAYVVDTLKEGGGEVKLWNLAAGKPLPPLTGGLDGIVPFVWVAISPDGKTVAASAQHSFRVWDVETRRDIFTVRQGDGPDSLEQGYDSGPTSLSFSPDGKELATLNLRGEVIIWNAATGKKIRTYHLRDFRASDIVFGPDGRLLATSGDGGLVKIWEVISGRELASLAFLDEKDWAIVTPEGLFDASLAGMKLMHYAYGVETIDLRQLKERYYEPGLLAKLIGLDRGPLREVVDFKSVALFPSVEVRRFAGDRGELSVGLSNRGGGIGRVQVFVNDKEFIADARPNGFDPNARQATLDLDLRGAPVVAGKPNRVRVVTYNQEGYLSSRGTLLSWDAPGAAVAAAAPELYAIVAGVSDYSSPQLKLRYAAKDASDIAKAFELGAKGLFGAERVHLKLLSSDRSNPHSLPPTKANFRKAFEEFARAKPTDVLVVYLAGHGITLPRSDTYLYLTQEARSKDGSVLSDPAVREVTSISSDELVEWIKKVPALKQVMILDTCAAGAAAVRLIERQGIAGDQIRAIERLKDRTGFHVLMGSAADAVSYEASQYGQGILTYVLLQGMSGAALRDDEFVDVQKLFQYAADGVPQLAKNVGGVQRPIVAAPGGTSFDVGRLSGKDKADIPLSKVKPLVLRPRLTLQELGDDTLGLMREVRERLRGASYFSETDKNPPKFVYVDEEEFPGALRLVGTYTVDGETVRIKLFLRRDDQTIRPLPAVEGSSRDVPALADKVFGLLMKALDDAANL